MVLAGSKQLKGQKYVVVRSDFREQLKADPKNVAAARMLAMTLVAQMRADLDRALGDPRASRQRVRAIVRSIPRRCHFAAVRAGALHLAQRNIDAVKAMNRAKELGGNPEKYFAPQTYAEIQNAASDEGARDFAALGLLTVVLAAASWLGLMFLLALLLAISIPRAPDPRVTATALHAREVWLERFYLLVLSVCLLVFYLTVPVVSLALLAIGIFLFVMLFILRILHIGLLQRGFIASWGVIRSVFLGQSRNVQGIAVDETSQPQLIGVLREVADKLETSPVDAAYLTPSCANLRL